MTALELLVLKELYKAGLIKFGEFKLSSGKTSQIYLDLRLLRGHPFATVLTARALLAKAEKLEYQHLADIPHGSSTIVTSMCTYESLTSPISMVTPRVCVQDQRQREPVIGIFSPGDTVLVVDDVITTADSKLEAIKILKDSGLVVMGVLVVVDREQGGAEKLREYGYALHSIFTLTEVLDYGIQNSHHLTDEELATLKECQHKTQ